MIKTCVDRDQAEGAAAIASPPSTSSSQAAWAPGEVDAFLHRCEEHTRDDKGT